MSLAYAPHRVAAGNLVLWRRNRPIGRKEKERGQDKGRRCAVSLTPGRRLVLQDFFEHHCDVRGNSAMCMLPENLGILRFRRTLQAGS